jgi:hypothetical protein
MKPGLFYIAHTMSSPQFIGKGFLELPAKEGAGSK